MDLQVDALGVTDDPLHELSELRLRDDGFLWLDIPVWSADAEQVLAEEFGFPPMAIAAARERNHTPRVHVYSDHVFIVIHAPEIGQAGHVHYLELDQFIGKTVPGHGAWSAQPSGAPRRGDAGRPARLSPGWSPAGYTRRPPSA